MTWQKRYHNCTIFGAVHSALLAPNKHNHTHLRSEQVFGHTVHLRMRCTLFQLPYVFGAKMAPDFEN